MSIDHLLDHLVSVWRKTESTGTLRSVTRSWSNTGRTNVPAAIQTRSEKQGDTGGGERTTGTYLGFMRAAADVQEGDIIQVTAGPGSWGFLLVDGVDEPRGHHTELELTDTAEDPTS
jgi:hypothetical protein